jgi:homocysteine S-methyltransferase
MTLTQLTADQPFIADGGLETVTRLPRRHRPTRVRGVHAARHRRPACQTLRSYYDTVPQTSPTHHGIGIVLDTATWRASLDWGARLGYDADAAHHPQPPRRRTRSSDLRRQHPGLTAVVNGVIGPTRGRLRRRHGDVGRQKPRLPRAAGSRVRRSRRRHDQRDHDDLRRRGDRSHPKPRPLSGSPSSCRSRSRPTATCHRDNRWATRSPRSTKPPERRRLLHDQLRPPDPPPSPTDDATEWISTRQRVSERTHRRSSHAELDAATVLDRGDVAELASPLPRPRPVFDLRVVGGCCGTDRRTHRSLAHATQGHPVSASHVRTPVLDHIGVPGLHGHPGRFGWWRREGLWGELVGSAPSD